MIGLALGIILLCVVVYGVLLIFKDAVPANIQKLIWLIVAVVILLWVANFFGYSPMHMPRGRD